jgi:hypothetical protein
MKNIVLRLTNNAYDPSMYEIVTTTRCSKKPTAGWPLEPPSLKWSAPIVRNAEDQVYRLRDPSLKRLS